VAQIRGALVDAGFVLSAEHATVRDGDGTQRSVALYDYVFVCNPALGCASLRSTHPRALTYQQARTLRSHEPNAELTWLWARTSGPDGPAFKGEAMHVIVAPRPGGTGPADHVDVLAYNMAVVSSGPTSVVSLAPFGVNACTHVRRRWLDAAFSTLYRDILDTARAEVVAIYVDSPSSLADAVADTRAAALDAILSGRFFRYEAREGDDGTAKKEGDSSAKRRRVQPSAAETRRSARIYLRFLEADAYVMEFGPRHLFRGKPPTIEQIAAAARTRMLDQPARDGRPAYTLGLAEAVADWQASLPPIAAPSIPKGASGPGAPGPLQGSQSLGPPSGPTHTGACMACSLAR
jgi:hypothetical protein